jgi:hypothetical protein
MAVSTEPPVLASSELSLALGSPPIGGPSPSLAPRINPVQFPGPTRSNLNFSLNSEFHHSRRGIFKIPPLQLQRSAGGRSVVQEGGGRAAVVMCAGGLRAAARGRTASGQTDVQHAVAVAVAEVEDNGILAILKNIG